MLLSLEVMYLANGIWLIPLHSKLLSAETDGLQVLRFRFPGMVYEECEGTIAWGALHSVRTSQASGLDQSVFTRRIITHC